MLSKNQIKEITALHHKKYRYKQNLFIAEGEKIIRDFLDSNIEIYHIFYTDDVLFADINNKNKTKVSFDELNKISALSAPNNCLAIFKIPKCSNETFINKSILVLDKVQDPGNLGTIIRTCDWFGVDLIVCSLDTVDVYNPKVVQASMGSLARIKVFYTDLYEFLKDKQSFCFGTFLNGNSIYEQKIPNDAIVIMGNEANGISAEIEKLIKNKILIPQKSNHFKTESLNVAIATAIILSEWKK